MSIVTVYIGTETPKKLKEVVYKLFVNNYEHVAFFEVKNMAGVGYIDGKEVSTADPFRVENHMIKNTHILGRISRSLLIDSIHKGLFLRIGSKPKIHRSNKKVRKMFDLMRTAAVFSFDIPQE